MKQMAKKNPMDRKFKNDELKFVQIKNENLMCKDCGKRYDDADMPCNTSKCQAYAIKPDKVLDGGVCIEYRKEKR